MGTSDSKVPGDLLNSCDFEALMAIRILIDGQASLDGNRAAVSGAGSQLGGICGGDNSQGALIATLGCERG